MTAHEDTPQDALSVFDFFEMLPDERAAIDFIENTRWPDGAVCPGAIRRAPKESQTRNVTTVTVAAVSSP